MSHDPFKTRQSCHNLSLWSTKTNHPLWTVPGSLLSDSIEKSESNIPEGKLKIEKNNF